MNLTKLWDELWKSWDEIWKDISPFTKPEDITNNNRGWWRNVATDHFKNWILIILILTTICLSSYTVIVFESSGFGLLFVFTLLVSLLFFCTSQWMMYMIYAKKVRHEISGWNKLKDHLNKHLNKHSLLSRVQDIYHDSMWIEHTPPFALFLYVLLVSVFETYIFLNLKFTDSPDFAVAFTLIFFAIIMTVKFCNDVYNLLNNCQKMEGLDNEL